MSRRLAPYMFAGLLGVASGVYIFRPLFEENTSAGHIRGETETPKPMEQLQQPNRDTAPQQGSLK